MAQFTIYKSTDSGAPTLSGTAGDLVNLLDKCLVAGYGSKTAAGWTKPFTGTNKAAFRQGAGSGFYLRVHDDTPTVANEAQLTGYESMSTVDVGLFNFPTAAQGPGGVLAAFIARKSATANATTRSWIVVADSRTCYVFVQTGDLALTYLCFGFGDIYTLLSGDLYNCGLWGRDAENSAATTGTEHLGELRLTMISQNGQVMARGYTGLAGSTRIGKHGDGFKATTEDFLGALTFPNPPEGGLYMSRVWVHDAVTGTTPNIRGRMRGLWQPLHAIANFTDGDTVIGSGDLAGKTFLMIKQVPGFANQGVVAVETSATIETN